MYSGSIDAYKTIGKFYQNYTDSDYLFKDDFCDDFGFDTPLLKTEDDYKVYKRIASEYLFSLFYLEDVSGKTIMLLTRCVTISTRPRNKKSYGSSPHRTFMSLPFTS